MALGFSVYKVTTRCFAPGEFSWLVLGTSADQLISSQASESVAPPGEVECDNVTQGCLQAVVSNSSLAHSTHLTEKSHMLLPVFPANGNFMQVMHKKT